MRVLVLVLHFITIFTSALVAGGQFFVLMVIVPVKRAFEARMSVQVHSAMLGHQTDRYMKPLGIASGVSGCVLLALPPERFLPNIAFLLVGLLGVLGVVITSRYFNVPSNREMAGWSLDALPLDYDHWRNRWDLVHTIRATAGLMALFGFVVSGLVR